MSFSTLFFKVSWWNELRGATEFSQYSEHWTGSGFGFWVTVHSDFGLLGFIFCWALIDNIMVLSDSDLVVDRSKHNMKVWIYLDSNYLFTVLFFIYQNFVYFTTPTCANLLITPLYKAVYWELYREPGENGNFKKWITT